MRVLRLFLFMLVRKCSDEALQFLHGQPFALPAS